MLVYVNVVEVQPNWNLITLFLFLAGGVVNPPIFNSSAVSAIAVNQTAAIVRYTINKWATIAAVKKMEADQEAVLKAMVKK